MQYYKRIHCDWTNYCYCHQKFKLLVKWMLQTMIPAAHVTLILELATIHDLFMTAVQKFLIEIPLYYQINIPNMNQITQKYVSLHSQLKLH